MWHNLLVGSKSLAVLRIVLIACVTSHSMLVFLSRHSQQEVFEATLSDPLWGVVVAFGNFALISSLVMDWAAPRILCRCKNPVFFSVLMRYRVAGYFYVGSVWATLAVKVYQYHGLLLFHASVVGYVFLAGWLAVGLSLRKRDYRRRLHCDAAK